MIFILGIAVLVIGVIIAAVAVFSSSHRDDDE